MDRHKNFNKLICIESEIFDKHKNQTIIFFWRNTSSCQKTLKVCIILYPTYLLLLITTPSSALLGEEEGQNSRGMLINARLCQESRCNLVRGNYRFKLELSKV